jgi:hypothetical protein
MNLWVILYAILLILVAFFSLRAYLRAPLSTPERVFFIIIRSTVILLLAAAFLEPVFHFRKLHSNDEPVPVLIDASQSMRLFNPDSAVRPALDYMQNSHSGGKRRFSFYLFGDSLRKAQNPANITFSDNSSLFPQIMQHDELRDAREVLLISDANWSNANFMNEHLFDKNILFALLPSPEREPFLKIKTPESISSPADSPAVIPVDIEGYCTGKENPVITVFQNGKAVYRKNLHELEGHFSLKENLSIPRSTPGKHLYRIEARIVSDSLRSSSYLLHHSLPGTFSWTHKGSSQSLDKRFLTLALKRRSDFRAAGQEEKPDILFLFDTVDAKKASSNLKRSSMVVFAGCLPCNSVSLPWPDKSKIVINETGIPGAFDGIDPLNLPPLSSILSCHGLRGTPLLSLIYEKDNRRDSVQLVYSTIWNNRNVLIISTRDTWKWDFWPMSLSRNEEESFLFSDRLISTLKDMLLARLSNHFYSWPYKSPRPGTIQFALSFPSEIPVSSQVKLICSFSDLSGKRVMDTTLTVINTGSAKQYMTIASLIPGEYLFSCSASSGKKVFTFKDSLFIEPDRSEFMVTAQNTSILREFGREINLLDTMSLQEISEMPESGTEAMLKSFRISRSWFLLTAILLLMLIEWGYRRTSGLG